MIAGPQLEHSGPETERAHQQGAPQSETAALGAVPQVLLAAAGADGTESSNARLASTPVMLQRSGSGELRSLVMRRMQRGLGNQKTQQLVAQMRRPAQVQRSCSCGGQCESCKGKAAEEEESKVVQRQPAGSTAEMHQELEDRFTQEQGRPPEGGAHGVEYANWLEQPNYDAAVALLQSRDPVMYGYLRQGRVGQTVRVKTQPVPVQGARPGSPTSFEFRFDLILTSGNVHAGALAQFQTQTPDLQMTVPTATATLRMPMNFSSPSGPNPEIRLAEYLYHEGIHMLLAMDRTIESYIPGSTGLQSGKRAAVEAYRSRVSSNLAYQTLSVDLEVTIGAYMVAHNQAQPPGSTYYRDAAQGVINGVIDERYAVDQQRQQFVGNPVANSTIAQAYIPNELLNEGIVLPNAGDRNRLIQEMTAVLDLIPAATPVGTAPAQANPAQANPAPAQSNPAPAQGNPAPPVQRDAEAGAEGGMVDANVIPSDSPERPLDHGTRSFMESRFGTDFSDVRVHTDSRAAESANQLSANAYTTGRDIYFAAGKYAPSSRDGQHLIAHELTHTVQQADTAGSFAASSTGNVEVGPADHPLEREAEAMADTVMSKATEPPEKMETVSRSIAQRSSVGGQGLVVRRDDNAGASPTTDDPALAEQLDDEAKGWEDGADQDDDLLLRALASRMVLLLKWLPRPVLHTADDLYAFTEKCDRLAKTELDTLNAFTLTQGEAALAFYPKGFPLTWQGRIKAALTIGADVMGLWTEWMAAWKGLIEWSQTLPPQFLDHGLPVPFDELNRLNDFHVYPPDAVRGKDSPVKSYARESIRYIQIRWVAAFAIAWEKTADGIASDVGAGKLVVNYLDWKDFVDNKQAILRALPERARNRIPDYPEQLQNESFPLKDAALLTGFVAGLAAIFGGILQGWKDASALFDTALLTADVKVAGSEDSSKIAMAVVWAWENNYFSGAAAEWAANAVKNIGSILKDMLMNFALLIAVQFVPGLDVAVDVYFAVRLGLDVLSWIDDLRSAFKQISNAGSVGSLQRAGARLAEVLSSGAIQLVIAAATWGIGKAVSKIRSRAAKIREETPTISSKAAEKQAFEEMSAAERQPLEEGKLKVDEFDKRYSADTKPILDTPGVRSKLSGLSEEARKLIELCLSPCLPPANQLLEADLKMLEDIQKRLGRPGFDRGLKEYFYNRRNMPGGLKQAIEDLGEVKKSNLDSFLAKEAKGAQKFKVGEAQKLVDPKSGKFAESALEDRYQKYLDRKKAANETPRDRADWKVASDYWTTDSPMARGNAFNAKAGQRYRYNEVHLENGKRLDSYDRAKGEIVSRKASDFDLIEQSTFEEYLAELKDKYKLGTKIRSDKYPRIDGERLQGQQILEVPSSNRTAQNRFDFEALAAKKGIKIRYTAE